MTEQPDSTGPRDDTARHDDAPDDIATSDSATRAGPAGDEAGQAETIAYSPPPEAHPEWANPASAPCDFAQRRIGKSHVGHCSIRRQCG